jgi:NADH dehydrogenase [ubiquinone] 1 alpha subcomplex assembly factor 7
MSSNVVQEILLDTIRRNGALPFSEFMRVALYHPHGYYNAQVAIGGRRGDFYTAAQSPLFARVMGRYVCKCWREFGAPDRLQVVELGAGQGELAANLCTYLSAALPDNVQVSYCIVEPSLKLAEVQRQALAERGQRIQVRWGQPEPELPTVLLANEVLDALPVEKVRKNRGRWEQACVAAVDESFCWEWRPADQGLSRLAEQWLPIADGEEAEICPDYPAFFADCARFGKPLRGIFIDYGIFLQEWAEGVRPRGTLRGYSRHSVTDVLERPGEVDLTADVHWDYAAAAARDAGFRKVDITSQGKFLVDHGITQELEEAAKSLGPEQYRRWTLQFRQLVLPGGMGERFALLECQL